MFKKYSFKKIGLEVSSICQLKCPACPTAIKATLPIIGKGFLSFKNFQYLLNENPWIKEIELSNYGEIFLNPELLEIIKLAYEKKVTLTANNGVNLNKVSQELLEGLVIYRFNSILCSLDGVTNETYRKYRIGGDYNTVIDNILYLNLLKKTYKSKYPLLTWQFIVFGHNENELLIAKQFASELNMAFFPKLSWDNKISPVKKLEIIRKEIGAASRQEYKEVYGTDYMERICYQLWEQPQINWDGKVLGCCRNFWSEFGGNVFKDGLINCLNNEKIKYARMMLLGKRDPRKDIPCSTCDIYLNMLREKNWVKKQRISKFNQN